MRATLYSPRDVAEIIGVSESTVKRWVDAGRIPVDRTMGGHRRIHMQDLLQFVREAQVKVVRPELIGLKKIDDFGAAGLLSAGVLYALLRDGDVDTIRSALVSSYLAGQPVAELMDDVVAPAFDRIGRLWKQSEEGVFVEHRATQAFTEALLALHSMLPEPSRGAQVFVGGVPPGDAHVLPALCICAMLRAEGFRVINLGRETPAYCFLHAVDVHRSAAVLVSATSTRNADVVSGFTRDLGSALRQRGVDLIVGGQAYRDGVIDTDGSATVLTRAEQLLEHVSAVN